MSSTALQTLYETFKDIQSFIGTIVGFFGVCLTLWYNAHVAENRRTKEIAHERKTTRVALASELSAMQTTLKFWKELLDEVVKRGEVGLPRSFDADGASRAYRAALPKIGLLTEEEIRQTVLAYSQYENLSKMSHEMQQKFDPNKPDKSMSLAFKAYVDAMSRTLSSVNDALDTITEAKVIEKSTQKI